MAKKRDASGETPREVEVRSPVDVPRPKGDPGPENTYETNPVYREYPSDPMGLLPGSRRKK